MSNEQVLTNKPLFGAQLDCSHPLTKRLVGCWLLNDNGYRAFDSSPYKNHGILNGFTSPTYSLGQRSSQGIKLNGTTTYVDCRNNDSLKITGAITIEAIIKLQAVVDDRIICKGATAGQRGWNLVADASGYYCQISSDGTAQVYIQLSTSPILNVWTHIVATYIPSISLNIYIDGILKGQNTTSIPASQYNSSSNVFIGKYVTSSYFNGTIGLIRVWNNRVMSNSEIKQLSTNPYDMFINNK